MGYAFTIFGSMKSDFTIEFSQLYRIIIAFTNRKMMILLFEKLLFWGYQDQKFDLLQNGYYKIKNLLISYILYLTINKNLNS